MLRPGGLLSLAAELLGLVYRPADDEPVPVATAAPSRPLRAGQPFRVMTWNIQFGGSRREKFFYDGGPRVYVPDADQEHALAEIANTLSGVDLALLQEVDRGSRRTNRRDQLLALAPPWASWATAPYHRARFVPVPARTPMGRVDMHLALVSAFGLVRAHRIQLPLLRESRLRQALGLKRALLCAEIPVEGWDRPLHVAVTHLSAFSGGDGTLGRQVAVLADWMGERERAGDPFVLGGDLNLLPPGDDPRRLGALAVDYAESPNPIEQLVPRFRSVIPPERLSDPANRTYLPWGAVATERMLDYLFVSDGIDVLSASPKSRPDLVSDHLPLVATIRLVHPPVRS